MVEPAPPSSSVPSLGHENDDESDASIVVKPALPLELAFYQALTSESAYDALRPYVPKFYGVLKLEGQVNESGGSEPVLEPIDGPKDEFSLT